MGNAINLYMALALAVLAWWAVGYGDYRERAAWRARHGGKGVRQ